MRWALPLLLISGCLPESATERRVGTVDAAVMRDAGADASNVEPAAEGCVTCHLGIEEMHPAAPLTCVECHGGNPQGDTPETAHIQRPAGLSRSALRRLSPDQLDALDPDVLRFANPGDLRVATRGCGADNPQAAQGGCHQPIVERARRSVMQTYVGHYSLPRFLAGSQGHDAIFGAVSVTDPDFKDAPGTVERLEPLRTPDTPLSEADPAQVLDRYLPQQCPWCHTASFGRNDAPRNYRSSGCSACHVLYDNEGRYRGADPTQDPTRTPAAATHALTKAIPTQQCERCHYQGARIGLSFQGIREGGFAEQPPRAVPLDEPAHGHGPGFYLIDEDAASAQDETPPDIHFERGMHCVDCHTTVEVHGDGRLHSTAKGQLDIACTDCHGTVRAAIQPDAEGAFRTAARGTKLSHLERDNEGLVWLVGKVDGVRHPVTQLADLLTGPRGANPRLQAGMGIDEDGFSHTDTMECWTCHTGWRPNCLGCHVTQDDRLTAVDFQTGKTVAGSITGQRMFQALDLMVLGQNARGKIDTLCPSMQMFFSWIDAEGVTRMERRTRTTAAGGNGYGWMPTFAHTIRPQARACTQCHLDEVGSNAALVRETYGFGSPERGFMAEDETGHVHDLTQVRDEGGAAIVSFPHAGSGPVPIDVVDRALSVRIDTGAERCNGVDDDGDGSIDEGYALISDPRNCGVCDVVCPDPAPACSVGRCLTRGWVSPMGDDNGGDGSRANPWATLAFALEGLPGEARRILLLPGVHTLGTPVEVPPQVQIEGVGLSRSDVELDGQLIFVGQGPGLGSHLARLTTRHPVHVRAGGLQIFDVVFDRPQGDPAVLDAEGSAVTIVQTSIRGARDALIRARGGVTLILRTTFEDNVAPVPLIEQIGGARLVLANDAFWRNSGPIARVEETGLNIAMTTIVDTAGDIALGVSAGRIDVTNNIFSGGVGRVLVTDEDTNPPRLSSNLVWHRGEGPEFEPPGTPHPGRVAADPRFVDPAVGDLHLEEGSPAIDVGDPDFQIDTDLEQVERPQGPGYDLGAFERSVPVGRDRPR